MTLVHINAINENKQTCLLCVLQSSQGFMGMVLNGARLRWLFNVGDKTAEKVTQVDVRSDGQFNSLFLER